ncbi:hypothetical protein ANANG_G00163780 [Anguilla anguilla]|uniref:Uncharacterized protein n=1 Tax=Anguilla anguilla TaxID=7936 RepID=A0A9D3RVG0_ANGAN|nr:hypothetical protein ANANG_G00163780 [Anguilla anguilla]
MAEQTVAGRPGRGHTWRRGQKDWTDLDTDGTGPLCDTSSTTAPPHGILGSGHLNTGSWMSPGHGLRHVDYK